MRKWHEISGDKFPFNLLTPKAFWPMDSLLPASFTSTRFNIFGGKDGSKVLVPMSINPPCPVGRTGSQIHQIRCVLGRSGSSLGTLWAS